MSFQALEQRANAAVKSKLSNRTATFNGAAIDVIFDEGYSLGDVGIGFEASDPSIDCDDADVVDVEHGSEFVIDAVAYKVSEIKPDGTGRTTLMLKK